MDWSRANGTATPGEAGAIGMIRETRNIILTAAGEAMTEGAPRLVVDRTGHFRRVRPTHPKRGGF